MFIQFRDGGLVPKVPQGLKDRLVGNLDQAAKRPVQFQDQEERGGHRKRRYHQGGNGGGVGGREHAEAEEKEREPKDPDGQEDRGDRGNPSAPW